MNHALQDLQESCDDEGTDEEVVGSDSVRIDELGLCEKVALQEVKVAEGEKHKQNSAGILDDSCGLLSSEGVDTHNYSAFL